LSDQDLPPLTDEVPEEEREAEPLHAYLVNEDGEPEDDA
jgi:hypothetical protein